VSYNKLVICEGPPLFSENTTYKIIVVSEYKVQYLKLMGRLVNLLKQAMFVSKFYEELGLQPILLATLCYMFSVVSYQGY
jgi:hypothetical protein